MLSDESFGDVLLVLNVCQLPLLAIPFQFPRIPNRMGPAHVESGGLKAWSGLMISQKELFAEVVAQAGIAHHHAVSNYPWKQCEQEHEH